MSKVFSASIEVIIWFLSFNLYLTHFYKTSMSLIELPGGLVVKNPSANAEDEIGSLGWEDILEKEMVTHSGILA